MQNKEKKLIENLFERLKKTELSAASRDESANTLIQKLVQEQPCSPYYMIQTILIQETAIKKMNDTIQELEKKLFALDSKNDNQNTSSSSSFLPKNTSSTATSQKNNTWHSNVSQNPYGTNTTAAPVNNNSSGFLTNALQTATGVAGGMILGNMLMNLFHHTKPEEEIFETIDTSVSDTIVDENIFSSSSNDFNISNNEQEYNDDEISLNNVENSKISNDIEEDVNYENNIDNEYVDYDMEDIDDNFI